MEMASLNPNRFEVIVRDNSEDSGKRAILQAIQSPTLKLLTVPNRGGVENFIEIVRAATGDFVIYLADDDWLSTRGLEQLHAMGEPFATDSSVSGLTGTFLIETSNMTGFLKFDSLDAFDAHRRLEGYFKANGPNVLFYAAIRRSVMVFCQELLERLPYKFSFHDQIMTLVYVAAGRLVQIDRAVYFYDLGEWESAEGTLAKDRAFYRESGLPVELDRLHWLICGLEGALLLRSRLLTDKGFKDAPTLASAWFSENFARFYARNREMGYADSPANMITQQIKTKWRGIGQANLSELLLDICSAFEVVDKDGADRYFNFWSTL